MFQFNPAPLRRVQSSPAFVQRNPTELSAQQQETSKTIHAQLDLGRIALQRLNNTLQEKAQERTQRPFRAFEAAEAISPLLKSCGTRHAALDIIYNQLEGFSKHTKTFKSMLGKLKAQIHQLKAIVATAEFYAMTPVVPKGLSMGDHIEAIHSDYAIPTTDSSPKMKCTGLLLWADNHPVWSL